MDDVKGPFLLCVKVQKLAKGTRTHNDYAMLMPKQSFTAGQSGKTLLHFVVSSL
jgi:hypothetical protein